MSLAIEIKNLSKTYKKSKTKVLENVNLNIEQGSFFGLLGPNGAGKSTMINIISGLVKKTSGSVKVCNYDIDKSAIESKFKIGVVPQELIIDPFFTIYETLEIYAGYYGIRKNKRKTLELVKAMGLEDKINSKPRSLSGGMKRRLLIAKALVHNPKILILDEPTAGVDINLRIQLWEYIKKLNEQGITILLTTHYLEEAEKLCDTIAILNNGKIILNDKKESLINVLDEKNIIVTYKSYKNNFLFLDKRLNVSSIDNEKIMIQYKPNNICFNGIIDLLQKDQYKITDITSKKNSLEDLFKNLITNN